MEVTSQLSRVLRSVPAAVEDVTITFLVDMFVVFEACV